MKKELLIKKLDERFQYGIAHRGLHNKEFTENGMKAFKNAIDHDTPFELDVHLTKDGYLIVSHDSNLERTTGKKGIIEDLTKDEIKNNYTLLDGGSVPLLEEVLELNNDKVPMVIELKAYHKNGSKVGKACKKMLKGKDKAKYVVISFFPAALLAFGKTLYRQLLISRNHPNMMRFAWLFESIDIDCAMLNQKRIVKYFKNHLVNTWTIDDKTNLDEIVNLADQFTYQFIDPDYMKNYLKSHK